MCKHKLQDSHEKNLLVSKIGEENLHPKQKYGKAVRNPRKRAFKRVALAFKETGGLNRVDTDLFLDHPGRSLREADRNGDIKALFSRLCAISLHNPNSHLKIKTQVLRSYLHNEYRVHCSRVSPWMCMTYKCQNKAMPPTTTCMTSVRATKRNIAVPCEEGGTCLTQADLPTVQ